MKPRFVEHLFVLIICASSLCLAADAGSEDAPVSASRLVFTNADLERCQQGLSRLQNPGEQWAETVVHGFFQVLLAAEVSLGRQD